MKKKAGRIGERFAREEWSLKGYKVIPKDQRKGGYDYLFVKREPYYSQNLPNQIYAEIKVNTSKQTRHQKEIEYEIINNGGTYWVTRYTVPLILADDMAG
ncbi:MAG: hypothetical protein PHT74_06615 [Methanoculleus horonobensis]|nr:hypothetical protein [Methanoculleus horonobensis]